MAKGLQSVVNVLQPTDEAAKVEQKKKAFALILQNIVKEHKEALERKKLIEKRKEIKEQMANLLKVCVITIFSYIFLSLLTRFSFLMMIRRKLLLRKRKMTRGTKHKRSLKISRRRRKSKNKRKKPPSRLLRLETKLFFFFFVFGILRNT